MNFVSHGKITHEVGAPCETCEEAQRIFEEDVKNGKVSKLIGISQSFLMKLIFGKKKNEHSV